MKLSIIIPVLNEENYLPPLLNSLKNQGLKDYEIIVADGGSKDRSLEIAKSFKCKIVTGGLPARGRNEGAKIAKGELLLFVDADVSFSRNSLKKFLKEFSKKKLDVASFLLKPEGNVFFIKLLYDTFYNLPVLAMEKILPHATGAILIKRKLHQKNQGFDELIKFGEDTDYVRRAARWGNFGILKSEKIYFSQRRFESRGWIKTYLKIVLAEIYMTLVGPIRSDFLKYRYGNYQKKIKYAFLFLKKDSFWQKFFKKNE